MRNKATRWGGIGMACGLVAWIGACAPADESEVADTAPPEATEAASAPTAAPDTTGAAMWAHMQAEDYRTGWELWPGLAEFYGGNAPHGMLLTTYANATAQAALQSGETVMPEGSIIIKENYMPDRELAAITVMYKRQGYNGEHADWFFAKFLPDGSLDAAPSGMALEGRVPGCQGCHIAQQGADYIYSPRPAG